MKKGSWMDFLEQKNQWSIQTFGSRESRGPKGPLLHLKKELDEEILNDLYNLSTEELLEELVDCIFLVTEAAYRAGFNPKQILKACWDKLEKNKKRKWNAPTSDEPVEHVRE